MGKQASLFDHSLRDGWVDLHAWAAEHLSATALGLVAALLGVPAYLVSSGVTMTALQDQLDQILAYSLIGPMLLVVVAYVFFCVRAPFRLYAKRVVELRDARIRLGESIEDLEEEPSKPGRFRRAFARYAYPTVIVFLLGVSIFFFYIIANIGRVIQINNLAVKAYQAETAMMIYLDLILTDKTKKICDDNKISSADCSSMRALDRKLHASWPYKGSVNMSLKEFTAKLIAGDPKKAKGAVPAPQSPLGTGSNKPP